MAKLKETFRENISQPVEQVIPLINPILRGWVNYLQSAIRANAFRLSETRWKKKIWGHLMRARQRSGFGWKRWSRQCLYGQLGLYDDYRLRRPWALPKVRPTESVS